MNNIQNQCRIIFNRKISSRYFHLQMTPPAARQAVPGQFVHIRISDGLEPVFRRPFSIYRAKKYVEIFYDVVGKGTQILASKVPGESLDVLGPLGNGFSLPPKGAKHIVMIAGGIGAAPFLALTDKIKNKGCALTLLYGGRSKEHTFSMKPFQDNGCKVQVATDDGSVGKKGRVSVLFAGIKTDPATTFVYTCGPKPMMKSVQEFCRKRGLRGEASLEEVMACGTGICLGCATKLKQGYKTVCFDGPVFNIRDLDC